MHYWLKSAVVAAMLLTAGCGGGVKEETTDVVQIAPADIIKATAESVVTSGAELGSGEEDLRAAIEELRKTDPAKAKAVEGEFEKMIKARDPASRKAAAKGIVSKL